MQNNPTPKPKLQAVTPAHLVVSSIVTALIAGGDAGFQYISTNGTSFSLVQLIGSVLVALFATLGTGVITLEKNPSVQQAIDGSLAPYVSALNSTLQQHSNLVQQAGQVVSYLVELAQHQAVQQAQQKPVQQQAPVQQPAPVRSPQQIPAINLANAPVPQQAFPQAAMAGQNFTRNFDTGLTPTINQ